MITLTAIATALALGWTVRAAYRGISKLLAPQPSFDRASHAGISR